MSLPTSFFIAKSSDKTFYFNDYFRANRAASNLRSAYRAFFQANAATYNINIVNMEEEQAFTTNFTRTQTDRYYIILNSFDDNDNEQYISGAGFYYSVSPHSGQHNWPTDAFALDTFSFGASGSSVGNIYYDYIDVPDDRDPKWDVLREDLKSYLTQFGFVV